MGCWVGPKMWYYAPEGIYEFDGGPSVCISDDIAPMFPQGDKAGFEVNGVQPINISASVRLGYHNGYLYLDYKDINSVPRTLVYDVASKSWYTDKYFAASTTVGFNLHFSEDGIESNIEIHKMFLAAKN